MRISISTRSVTLTSTNDTFALHISLSQIMLSYSHLDAHEKPPELLRRFFKARQKSDLNAIKAVIDSKDVPSGLYSGDLVFAGTLSSETLQIAFSQFLSQEPQADSFIASLVDSPMYELKALPGQLPYARKPFSTFH
jgi:hypothetical protein